MNKKTSIQTLFVVLFLLGAINLCTAQVDQRSASIKIDGPNTNKIPKESNISLFDYNKKDNRVNAGSLFIKNEINLSDPFAAKEKRTVQFVEGNDFIDKDYSALEKKLNKSVKTPGKEAKLKDEYYKDQNLGQFNSGSAFVNFVYRDHQAVDGDRVSVSINDVVVNPNVWLAGEFRGFYMDLKKGFNKIEITALNQGESGPNTAQFIMYDDQENEISSNIWNLATGVTATVIIIKDN